MTLELAAIVVVVFLLATAWLIAKDKSIKEDEEKFANVVQRKAEQSVELGPGKYLVVGVGGGGGGSPSLPTRKKQASRKRSKASGRRAKRKSGGNRK